MAEDADIIWACSDSFYGVIACILKKINGFPVVFDIYDNFDFFFAARLPLGRQLYHWALRQSDAVTCLSNAFAKHLKNRLAPRQNVYPIEFAVRSDLFHPLPQIFARKKMGLPFDVKIIGTAGALSKVRETPLLLKAFESLLKRHPNLHLALAGPRDFPIPDDPRIHDFGILKFQEVPLLINSLDVAVVCYADDEFGKFCFPQKTREFMACDVPVVAADIGSLKDIFSNNRDWLYKPGNVISLAATIEKRLTDNQTEYPTCPEWPDLALRLEKVLNNVYRGEKSILLPSKTNEDAESL
jgi:glycosyltransferase involved in cell wall biosynthesis